MKIVVKYELKKEHLIYSGTMDYKSAKQNVDWWLEEYDTVKLEKIEVKE